METIFLHLFELKNDTIKELESHHSRFRDNLLVNCTLKGIDPPPWLRKITPTNIAESASLNTPGADRFSDLYARVFGKRRAVSCEDPGHGLAKKPRIETVHEEAENEGFDGIKGFEPGVGGEINQKQKRPTKIQPKPTKTLKNLAKPSTVCPHPSKSVADSSPCNNKDDQVENNKVENNKVENDKVENEKGCENSAKCKGRGGRGRAKRGVKVQRAPGSPFVGRVTRSRAKMVQPLGNVSAKVGKKYAAIKEVDDVEEQGKSVQKEVGEDLLPVPKLVGAVDRLSSVFDACGKNMGDVKETELEKKESLQDGLQNVKEAEVVLPVKRVSSPLQEKRRGSSLNAVEADLVHGGKKRVSSPLQDERRGLSTNVGDRNKADIVDDVIKVDNVDGGIEADIVDDRIKRVSSPLHEERRESTLSIGDGNKGNLEGDRFKRVSSPLHNEVRVSLQSVCDGIKADILDNGIKRVSSSLHNERRGSSPIVDDGINADIMDGGIRRVSSPLHEKLRTSLLNVDDGVDVDVVDGRVKRGSSPLHKELRASLPNVDDGVNDDIVDGRIKRFSSPLHNELRASTGDGVNADLEVDRIKRVSSPLHIELRASTSSVGDGSKADLEGVGIRADLVEELSRKDLLSEEKTRPAETAIVDETCAAEEMAIVKETCAAEEMVCTLGEQLHNESGQVCGDDKQGSISSLCFQNDYNVQLDDIVADTEEAKSRERKSKSNGSRKRSRDGISLQSASSLLRNEDPALCEKDTVLHDEDNKKRMKISVTPKHTELHRQDAPLHDEETVLCEQDTTLHDEVNEKKLEISDMPQNTVLHGQESALHDGDTFLHEQDTDLQEEKNEKRMEIPDMPENDIVHDEDTILCETDTILHDQENEKMMEIPDMCAEEVIGDSCSGLGNKMFVSDLEISRVSVSAKKNSAGSDDILPSGLVSAVHSVVNEIEGHVEEVSASELPVENLFSMERVSLVHKTGEDGVIKANIEEILASALPIEGELSAEKSAGSRKCERVSVNPTGQDKSGIDVVQGLPTRIFDSEKSSGAEAKIKGSNNVSGVVLENDRFISRNSENGSIIDIARQDCQEANPLADSVCNNRDSINETETLDDKGSYPFVPDVADENKSGYDAESQFVPKTCQESGGHEDDCRSSYCSQNEDDQNHDEASVEEFSKSVVDIPTIDIFRRDLPTGRPLSLQCVPEHFDSNVSRERILEQLTHPKKIKNKSWDSCKDISQDHAISSISLQGLVHDKDVLPTTKSYERSSSCRKKTVEHDGGQNSNDGNDLKGDVLYKSSTFSVSGIFAPAEVQVTIPSVQTSTLNEKNVEKVDSSTEANSISKERLPESRLISKGKASLEEKGVNDLSLNFTNGSKSAIESHCSSPFFKLMGVDRHSVDKAMVYKGMPFSDNDSEMNIVSYPRNKCTSLPCSGEKSSLGDQHGRLARYLLEENFKNRKRFTGTMVHTGNDYIIDENASKSFLTNSSKYQSFRSSFEVTSPEEKRQSTNRILPSLDGKLGEFSFLNELQPLKEDPTETTPSMKGSTVKKKFNLFASSLDGLQSWKLPDSFSNEEVADSTSKASSSMDRQAQMHTRGFGSLTPVPNKKSLSRAVNPMDASHSSAQDSYEKKSDEYWQNMIARVKAETALKCLPTDYSKVIAEDIDIVESGLNIQTATSFSSAGEAVNLKTDKDDMDIDDDDMDMCEDFSNKLRTSTDHATCFPIEEESSDEMNEFVDCPASPQMSGIDRENVVMKNVLRDSTLSKQNSPVATPSNRKALQHGKENKVPSVQKKPMQHGSSVKNFQRGRVTPGSSRLANSVSSTKSNRKYGNVVTNVSSFLPMVQQKQTTPSVLTGKRDIKVKALEVAEAAKRMEEKKEQERRMKKEQARRGEQERLLHQDKSKDDRISVGSAKSVSSGLVNKKQLIGTLPLKSHHEVTSQFDASTLEPNLKRKRVLEAKAKLEEEKRRKLIEEQKRKEDERRKKEAELAAKKRKREEQEKKEREEKRKRVEEMQRQKKEHEELLRAQLEEKENRHRALEEYERRKKTEEEEDKKQRRIQRERAAELKRQEETKVGRNGFPESKQLDDYHHQPTEAVQHHKLNAEKVSSLYGGVSNSTTVQTDGRPQKLGENMQSYDISPYKPSDDEDDYEEEDHAPKKFIPLWARKENILPALVRQRYVDPDNIFVCAKTCSLNEVFGKDALSRKDINKRGVSGEWHFDKFTSNEEYLYKVKMGYIRDDRDISVIKEE